MIQNKCYLWFLTYCNKSWCHDPSTHVGRTFSVCHLLHKSEKNMKTLDLARCRFIPWYSIPTISLNLLIYEKMLISENVYHFLIYFSFLSNNFPKIWNHRAHNFQISMKITERGNKVSIFMLKARRDIFSGLQQIGQFFFLFSYIFLMIWHMLSLIEHNTLTCPSKTNNCTKNCKYIW